MFAADEMANKCSWQVAQVDATEVGQGQGAKLSEWRRDFQQAVFPEKRFLRRSGKTVYRVIGWQDAGRIAKFKIL